MKITENDLGNDFMLDGQRVARLLNDPTIKKPYRTNCNGYAAAFNHHEAAVVAHAFLSGLRSQVAETPDDDMAFALVLVLLERFVGGDDNRENQSAKDIAAFHRKCKAHKENGVQP